MIKITPAVLGWALLAAIGLSIGCWFYLVISKYGVPEAWWFTLPHWLFHTLSILELRWIGVGSVAMGFGSVFGLILLLAESGNGERTLRGARLVKREELAKRTRLRRKRDKDGETIREQVELASVPLPLACEPSHFLFAGSTNTGKSTAMDQLLATALERGDRIIVIDPNGHALSRFGKRGDEIMNPFDQRAPGWSLFNEFRKPYDFERFAKSVVPDSSDPGSQQWHGYAQQLLAETTRAMAQAGENTTERLLYWLTQANAQELAAFLAGSAASGLFEPGAEKALASTRFILSHYISAYQHLQPGDFSLRNWLENSDGNLFITWREDMLTTLCPLVSGWVDILISSILTLPTESPRPLWLFLDELASLERLTSLEAGLTKGRKHGLRVVAGLQSVAQLDAIYGHDNAKTLRSCFRNILALGCSNADPDTAEVIAKGLGQAEIERTQTTHTSGQSGGGKSTSSQRSTELLVLPSQLTALEPLHGYLKLAGDYPVAKIRLVRGDYPVRATPFVER